MPTHGSCLPLTEIVVFLPNLSTVFLLFRIDEVGLTAKETIISWPLEIPPRIPPALFESNFNFDSFRKESILKGLDDIGITLEFEEEISNFELKLKKWINSKFTYLLIE